MKKISDFFYRLYWDIRYPIWDCPIFWIKEKRKQICYTIEMELTNVELPFTHTLGVYDSEEKALVAAKKVEMEVNYWLNNVPLPLKFYKNEKDELERKESFFTYIKKNIEDEYYTISEHNLRDRYNEPICISINVVYRIIRNKYCYYNIWGTQVYNETISAN